MFAFAILLGTLGFMYYENYSLNEAFYMTMITISTVGYTEVKPLSETGRNFAAFLILINIGIFAYAVSAFTHYVVQGEIFKTIHKNYVQRKIDQLHNHIILCGYGRYGHSAVDNFVNHDLPFVVIEQATDKIEEIQQGAAPILYVEGDATHDEILQQAGVERASALVTALPDDTNNLFIVLTARQMNKKLNIISRAISPKAKKKLLLAGANHVIQPDQIGGFFMATLVNKPHTIEFFNFITDKYHADMGFEEVAYESAKPEFKNKTIKDLQIRKKTGANVIGYSNPEGKYFINPKPETVFAPGCSLIVLGNEAQLKAFCGYMK